MELHSPGIESQKETGNRRIWFQKRGQDASALLWDVDGTLIDTTALITKSLDHIYLKFYGRSLSEEERRALIGTPLKTQIRVFGEPEAFGVKEEEITEEFITFYETHRSEERLLFEVIDILKEGKRRGIPTGLVTSKNHEELANTLPRLGITESVDTAVTADDVAHPKPAPEGILQALAHLGIGPEQADQVYYIGDTVHDMQAAKAAGVRGIGVTWGAATRPHLEQESPFAIVDTPEELHRLLYANQREGNRASLAFNYPQVEQRIREILYSTFGDHLVISTEEVDDGRVFLKVVSEKFNGLTAREKQDVVWEALEQLGPETKAVSLALVFGADEI